MLRYDESSFQFYKVRLKDVRIQELVSASTFQFYKVRLKEHRKHDNAFMIINVFRCKYM